MNAMRTPYSLLLWVILLVAPFSAASAPERPLSSGYSGGKVVAAVPRYFPPYYQTNSDGSPAGFAIDIMDAIAKQAGIVVRYKVYANWAEVQDAIKTGEAHLIPNMGDIPERRNFLDFTPPLEQFRISIFARQDHYQAFITTLPKGARVATTHSNAARKIIEKMGDYEIVLYDDVTKAVDAVLSGAVDALALPEPIVFEHLNSRNVVGTLFPVGPPLATISRAIGVAKAHPDLLKHLTSVTAAFTESKDYERIYRKWHGGEAELLGLEDILYVTTGLMVIAILTVWLGYFLRAKLVPRGTVEGLLSSSQTAHHLRLRVMILAAVMLGGIALAVFATLYLHYQHTLEQTKIFLQDTLSGQVEVIKSFSNLPFDLSEQAGEMRARTILISQLRSAQTRFVGIGEMTIAEQSGDSFYFILRQRHWDHFSPAHFPSTTNVAEPMRLALSGQRGVVVGPDYRNEQVLAAYDYIDVLDLGIVFKMDIADIQAPHFRMAIYGSLFSFVIAMLSTLIYIRVIMPVIREIQLKEAEYDGFRDNTQAIMFIMDLDGKITDLNTAYANLFDTSREQLLQDLNKRNLSPSVLEQFDLQNQEIIKSGQPLDITETMTINGAERTFLTKKFPVFTGDDAIFAIGGIAIDVTDLHAAEVALTASEERFRATFEQAAVGLGHLSLDGKWMLVNNVMCLITGYTRDEMLGMTYKDITHTDDLAKNMELVRQLRDGEIKTYIMEKRYIRKDGAVTWVNITGSLVRDQDGEPAYFIGVIEDINQRIADRDEIARQRDRVSSYLQLAGTLIIALNTKGEVVLANQYAHDLLGYDNDEMIGADWFDLAIPPKNRDRIREVANKVLRGDLDEVAYYENEIITKSGERRLIGWNNTYLHEPNGSITTLLSSGIDITNSQLVLTELKRSNRFLRTISRCNEVLVHTTQQGQLLRDICRLIVEEGEYRLAWVSFIRDESGRKFIPVERYGNGQEAIEKCMDIFNSDAVLSNNHPTIFHDVIKDVCPPDKDGYCARHGLRSLCILPLMEAGDPFGALFIVSSDSPSFNETEIDLLSELANDLAFGLASLRKERMRRKALDDLYTSEERSRAIIEYAHDAIISIDTHGLITQFNPSAEAMFDCKRDDTIGKLLEDTIIPERYRKKHKKGFEHFVQTGSTPLFGQKLDLYGLRADGSEFPLELTLSPMPGETQDVCTAVIRDTTDRYDAERHRRQAQNMESLGNLAGGMAHDINNMLLPIVNLTAMVRRTLDVNSNENKKLAMVEQAAERVKDLVESILTFSRQDSPMRESLSIHEVLRTALKLISPTTPKTITIKESLEPFAGGVHVDEGQITAALVNLFNNAADAMEGHVGQIELKLRHIEPRSSQREANTELRTIHYAKISVIDNGCGMAPEVLARALDPFFTTKPPGQGTGLGLSMVSGIIAKHEGVMEVSSSPGHGARVDLYLPLQLSKKTTATESKSPKGATEAPLV